MVFNIVCCTLTLCTFCCLKIQCVTFTAIRFRKMEYKIHMHVFSCIMSLKIVNCFVFIH